MTFSTQRQEAALSNRKAAKARDDEFADYLAEIRKFRESRRKRRNHMLEFKINEISFVDSPAQEGAKAVIMKRADELPPVTPTTVKVETPSAPKPVVTPATFNEAVILLKAQGMDGVRAMQRAADRYPDLLKRYQAGEEPKPAPGPFKSFEEAVSAIRESEQCNGMVAMQKARAAHPDLFLAYQKAGAVSSRPVYQKATPSRAKQEWNLIVDGIAAREKCTRDAAMSRARRDHPAAFAAAYE